MPTESDAEKLGLELVAAAANGESGEIKGRESNGTGRYIFGREIESPPKFSCSTFNVLDVGVSFLATLWLLLRDYYLVRDDANEANDPSASSDPPNTSGSNSGENRNSAQSTSNSPAVNMWTSNISSVMSSATSSTNNSAAGLTSEHTPQGSNNRNNFTRRVQKDPAVRKVLDVIAEMINNNDFPVSLKFGTMCPSSHKKSNTSHSENVVFGKANVFGKTTICSMRWVELTQSQWILGSRPAGGIIQDRTMITLRINLTDAKFWVRRKEALST